MFVNLAMQQLLCVAIDILPSSIQNINIYSRGTENRRGSINSSSSRRRSTATDIMLIRFVFVCLFVCLFRILHSSYIHYSNTKVFCIYLALINRCDSEAKNQQTCQPSRMMKKVYKAYRTFNRNHIVDFIAAVSSTLLSIK